jgi:hypoxanthine phosphoribosyltransferase
LNYVTNNIKEGSKILIVDDVFDSGKSISAVIVKLTGESKISSEKLDIRIATIFYKPKRNLTYRKPEYYVEETDEWLVFPHEVENMTLEEITTFKGSEIGDIFKGLK